MVKHADILNLIYDEIGYINESFKLKSNIEPKEDTVILGPNSGFDSLAFVHLVSAIEDWIDDNYDIMIVLADEQAIGNPEGPFQSVGALANHTVGLVNAELVEQ